jgi:hypothetical protein
VARFEPARLVLYELSEFNLYTIEQELTERFPRLELVRLIGDVKDLEHLRHTFAQWKPQVVFHAAAYKHVPLMEEDHNALACVRNNVLGTYNAALAAAEHGAERFVLISTDKAVNPTNVMGASKRAAEMVISQMAADHPRTRFMAVRFGNVLGSSGSVIPKFKEQIARGGPITVTHPEIIHDHSRGGASGAAGRRDRRERAGTGARHGRADEDRGTRPRDDPASRAPRRRDCDRNQRFAAGRKALRGVADGWGGTPPDECLGHSGGTAADQLSGCRASNRFLDAA